MQVRLEVTLDTDEATKLIQDDMDLFKFDSKECRTALASAVVDAVGVGHANGGWTFGFTEPKGGGVKLIGNLVPTGSVVIR